MFGATITSLSCVVVALCAGRAVAQAPPEYGAHFADGTMRLDVYHTGGMGQELISVDHVVADGSWPGSRTQLIDGTELGVYRFEIRDDATGALLYSRGYASIFGEWQTTSEAASVYRTFHESLRFPWPLRPVRVVLQRRGAAARTRPGAFEDFWSTRIDPAARSVNRAVAAPATVLVLQEHGSPATKVDLVLVAEGYTAADSAKFVADAHRMVEELFREEPFRSRRTDFNVRAVFAPAAESGIHRVRGNVHRRTRTGTEYNIFDSERYVLATDNRGLRDLASSAPYDYVEVLVNDAQYGGGGIFNDHATVAVDNEFAPYVFVHEFGHHFAALADEYYTSSVAYETGAAVKLEPPERNVTALHDPAQLKWKDLVQPGSPLPTPWEKAEFDAHSRDVQQSRAALVDRNAPPSAFDSLFVAQRAWEEAFFRRQRYAGRVGAFEGAGYEYNGLYRPALDCIMFSRNRVGFCAVCRRAITEIIDLHTH